ncbi:MAG TPA: Ni/Fe hydrogenase subunit alpha [Streptosporangiaceae bacterium]|nr:Ni/Fe hydrogenase subunit alpha [Streptosporangiaceae bacterium]
MTHRRERTLTTAGIARVEGEGSLYLRLSDGHLDEVRLNIYEPPRFFEAFLRGRSYTEPPDITARICGICPVAYQTSSALAIEAACGARVDGPLASLRRLLYCGEWIASHSLHIYLLHAPDFLGYPGGIELARDQRAVIERGLALRRAGNAIMEAIGGRAIHPVNFRIGGFYSVPAKEDLDRLAGQLQAALDDAVETVRWVAGFDFPDLTVDHELLALSQPGSYPIESGSLVSSGGRAFSAADFEEHVIEEQVPHSTALHARLAGSEGTYLTGPLARYTLNSRWLPPLAAAAAADAGLGDSCRNPFRSIIVRAVEVVCAVEEAIRLIEGYQRPPLPSVAVAPRAATGHGVSEAPRGVLYQRYDLDAEGIIVGARIIPPTSQNQAAIERDLRQFVQARLELPDEQLAADCEHAIRSYDPCISCATHFLDLQVERT